MDRIKTAAERIAALQQKQVREQQALDIANALASKYPSLDHIGRSYVLHDRDHYWPIDNGPTRGLFSWQVTDPLPLWQELTALAVVPVLPQFRCTDSRGQPRIAPAAPPEAFRPGSAASADQPERSRWTERTQDRPCTEYAATVSFQPRGVDGDQPAQTVQLAFYTQIEVAGVVYLVDFGYTELGVANERGLFNTYCGKKVAGNIWRALPDNVPRLITWTGNHEVYGLLPRDAAALGRDWDLAGAIAAITYRDQCEYYRGF